MRPTASLDKVVREREIDLYHVISCVIQHNTNHYTYHSEVLLTLTDPQLPFETFYNMVHM